MYGKNILMKMEYVASTEALSVHSIFYTVQGEGPFAGRAATFVRLFGCSLACSWCDTDFESNNFSATPAQLLAHITRVSPKHCNLIVLTGGEPTRQNISPFISAASSQGYTVQVETAGVHSPPGFSELMASGEVEVVCSPKTHKLHPDIVKHCRAFKYIIDAREEFSKEDGLPLHAVSQRNEPATATLYRPNHLLPDWEVGRIFVQPLDVPDLGGGMHMLEVMARKEERDKHNWENMQRCARLVMDYGYRLCLQQHKILDLP